MSESSSWSLESVKQYVDTKFADLQKVMDEREKASLERWEAVKEAIKFSLNVTDKALIKAEVANDKRFESVNEFRKTLTDQNSSFITRAEYTVQHRSLSDRLDDFEKRRSSGMIAVISSIAGMATIGGFVYILATRSHL